MCYLRPSKSQTKIAVPPPQLPEHVKLFWQPQIGTPAPIILSNFAANNGNDAYRDMYLDILKSHVPSFRGLLTYVRDEFNAGSAGQKKAILFHCHGILNLITRSQQTAVKARPTY